MQNDKRAMVSRSLRLREDTLKVLEKEAIHMNKGITVLIRDILEEYVATKELLESLVVRGNTFEVRESLV